MHKRSWVLCLCGLLTAGCSTSVSVAPAHGVGESTTAGNPVINITPFSDLSWQEMAYPTSVYSNVYARLKVLYEPLPGQSSAAGTDFLSYRERTVVERFLMGRHASFNITAKVAIGSFTATVPLVSLDHVSNSTSGEVFSRVIYRQAKQYPLFLVRGMGGEDVVSIQFSVRRSHETQTGAAALGLQLVQQAVALAAPETAVLTTLTAQSSKDIATALDRTVSQLYDTSISESQWIDKDTALWGGGVRAQFKLPVAEWDLTGGEPSDYRSIGSWTVTLSRPRPSIFSQVQICDPSPPVADETSLCEKTFAAAARRAQADAAQKAASVLAFSLIGALQDYDNIGAYLTQQGWWSAAEKKFLLATAPHPEDVAQFCRSIKTTVAGLGLNNIDGGIVVDAVRQAANLPLAVTHAMAANTTDCGYAVK